MQQQYQCDPARLQAAIGPSISQAAFEVGEEVVEAFREAGFELVYYRCCRKGEGDRIDHKGRDQEPVGDQIGLQVHQGQAEKTAGQCHPAKCIKAKAVAQDAPEKGHGK